MLHIIDNFDPTMMVTGQKVQLFKFIEVNFEELMDLDAFNCINSHVESRVAALLSQKTGKKIATAADSSSFYFTDMVEEDEVLLVSLIGKRLKYWWVVPINTKEAKYELAEDIAVDRYFEEQPIASHA